MNPKLVFYMTFAMITATAAAALAFHAGWNIFACLGIYSLSGSIALLLFALLPALLNGDLAESNSVRGRAEVADAFAPLPASPVTAPTGGSRVLA